MKSMNTRPSSLSPAIFKGDACYTGQFATTIFNATQCSCWNIVLTIRNNRAVYTRENKPRLTLAAAYIRRERNHLYEYGLY